MKSALICLISSFLDVSDLLHKLGLFFVPTSSLLNYIVIRLSILLLHVRGNSPDVVISTLGLLSFLYVSSGGHFCWKYTHKWDYWVKSYVFICITLSAIFVLSVCTKLQSLQPCMKAVSHSMFSPSLAFCVFFFFIYMYIFKFKKKNNQNWIITGHLCKQWDIVKFAASVNPLDFHLHCKKFRMTYWITTSAELLMKSKPCFILEDLMKFALLWGPDFVKPAGSQHFFPCKTSKWGKKENASSLFEFQCGNGCLRPCVIHM